MSLSSRKVTVGSIVVSGFAPDATKRDIEAAGWEYADWLQASLARLYDKESVAGGKLAPNSPAYTKWKKRQGFSTKRGHLTGNTQAVLDSEDIMTVVIRGAKGKYRCTVTVSRPAFYKAVGGGDQEVTSYIEWYEKTHVPNETITAFKPGWARNARSFFEHLEG